REVFDDRVAAEIRRTVAREPRLLVEDRIGVARNDAEEARLRRTGCGAEFLATRDLGRRPDAHPIAAGGQLHPRTRTHRHRNAEHAQRTTNHHNAPLSRSRIPRARLSRSTSLAPSASRSDLTSRYNCSSGWPTVNALPPTN